MMGYRSFEKRESLHAYDHGFPADLKSGARDDFCVPIRTDIEDSTIVHWEKTRGGMCVLSMKNHESDL